MSVSQTQMRKAVRARLVTLSVTTTGAISMSVTATSYVRAAGSFLADGIYAGMEVLAAGFSVAGNNGLAVVMAVSDTTLTVTRALTAEVAAAGKTLTVGLPSGCAWENEPFTPTIGTPHVEEEVRPGEVAQITLSREDGILQVESTYVVHIHVPDGVGADAANGYADALLSHFRPQTTMALTNGDLLMVHGRPAPYRGQLIERKAGWATVPVTVPVWLTTVNA